jgi:hypothetical protein
MAECMGFVADRLVGGSRHGGKAIDLYVTVLVSFSGALLACHNAVQQCAGMTCSHTMSQIACKECSGT